MVILAQLLNAKVQAILVSCSVFSVEKSRFRPKNLQGVNFSCKFVTLNNRKFKK